MVEKVQNVLIQALEQRQGMITVEVLLGIIVATILERVAHLILLIK